MTKLYLDFETRSTADLKIVGLDNYAKNESTEAILLGWAFDDDEPALWFPHGGRMPPEVQEAIESDVTLVAWNSTFERFIFHYPLKTIIPASRFLDPMVWARHLSLPGHLADAGMAIGLPNDLAKQSDGKRLIKKFSMPYHKGGEETLFGISEPQFHNGEDEPRDWALFGEYCKQDVIAERAILKLVSNIPLPESEQRAWILDQKINDRGIPVNRKFVQNALALSLESKKRLTVKLKEITQLVNPNSRDQFLGWATKQQYPHMSLGKNFVKAALAPDSGITPLCRQALLLRQEASKTSYTKFETLLNMMSSDDRLRHAFLFMGASRTGRWSGKGSHGGSVQVQNLSRPDKIVEAHYQEALSLIEEGDYEKTATAVLSWYPPDKKPEFAPVMGMCISCVRSAFQVAA